MGKFCIFMLGKLRIHYEGQLLRDLEAQRAQELLCYLLIYRDRPHTREKLSNLLWESSSPSQSKQYLRQTLWQLQSALEGDTCPQTKLLSVGSEWIGIQAAADFWLDVDKLERGFSLCHGSAGHELNSRTKDLIEKVVQLYQGDLLENWYQDWCIFERERVQNIYLTLLDKLMSYYEWHQEFDRGITYGAQILRCDMAHEQTYRRLMRLYYLAGDRTGALRQYDRCVSALEHELGVKPDNHTISLYQEIKEDRFSAPLYRERRRQSIPKVAESLSDILHRLNRFRATLLDAQRQVERDIEVISSALDNQR
jgi:DNA-binding SARP family transcriptional activator